MTTKNNVSVSELLSKLNELSGDGDIEVNYFIRMDAAFQSSMNNDLIKKELFVAGDIDRRQICINFLSNEVAYVIGVWKKSCADELAMGFNILFSQCGGRMAFDTQTSQTFVFRVLPNAAHIRAAAA